MVIEVKKSVCYFCKGYCPVLVHTENGRLVPIEAPCKGSCPAGIDVPRYVRFIGEGKFGEALAVIREKIPFPSVCGYVCHHPCEAKCNRGQYEEPIAIRDLKRFAAEHGNGLWEHYSRVAPSTGKRVAIIGSGPAGLTAGYYLAKQGHEVTVFEELPEPGGMLRMGIPEYRLPRQVLDSEIKVIEEVGIDIKTNMRIESLDKLFEQGYNAVYLSIGAHQVASMGVEGENSPGVIECISFLRDVNLNGKAKVGNRVAVIGGGNAAIDASRAALRLGAKEVAIIYRRSRSEMPAISEDIDEALKEGIEILFLAMPVKITRENGKLEMECIRMKLGEVDASGRRQPEPINGTEFTMEFDTIIAATGQMPEIPAELGLTIGMGNTLQVDTDSLATSREGVFAGGDAITGPASVIEAIAAGRKTATSIDKYLGGSGQIEETLAPPEEAVPPPSLTDLQNERHMPLKWKRPRQEMPELPINERLGSFTAVELGFSEEAAIKEARRCMSCDLDCVEADPDYPADIFPLSTSCDRKHITAEYMYHPGRINYPLKRAGERGEGKWDVISWEQAFDEIAAKLKELKDKYGAETLAGFKGTARNKNFMPRLFNLFGSPNCVTIGKICAGPLFAVQNAMFGYSGGRYGLAGGHSHADGASSPKCIFLTGTDPFQSWPRVARAVMDCKETGGKLIVVDPRETESTRIADIWLQLRPGTDTALFMSMINVVIEEGLYDKEFVEKWCYGFDKLVERAQEYPPEKVAEITWVPADKIREAARMIGNNKPHYSWNGMGTEQLQNSIQAIHARFILAAITGSLDVPGGTDLSPMTGRGVRGFGDVLEADKLTQEQRKKQLGADRFKFMCWPGYELMEENMRGLGIKPSGDQMMVAAPPQPAVWQAILTGKPYPVKALITMAHSVMTIQPNTKDVYDGLKNKLDLHVSMDYFMTPGAELADYVLPVACWLERAESQGSYGGETALPPSIPGEYDRKSDYEILRGIGLRLGQDWPWKNLEEVYDYWYEPLGITYKQFLEKPGAGRPPEYKKYEKVGFATTTGKAELSSTVMEKLGYDPLPKYEEPPESPISTPDVAKEFPLILITGGRFRPLFHSEFRQIDSLRERRPHPLVNINQKTAKELGIEDGDWVWIESPRGRIRQKCKYHNIDPRVVHCEHGWWFPELPGEEPWLHGVWDSNVNILTDNDLDHCNPLHGGWPLKTALCKVYKAKQY